MAKLARKSAPLRVPRGTSPITTISRTPDAYTAKGGAGHSRDVKSELFTLAVSNFVGEQTFHERADQRDARFLTLIHQATAEDPEWTANLLYWLRTEGLMRSASVVGAVEYGRATAQEGFGWNLLDSGYTARAVLDSVLQRADEPAEALGYWLATYGRPLPKWLKRGIGDAADRLYTPYATFKYDGLGQTIRFGDVVEMTEAKTAHDRFKWQLDRKFGRVEGDYGVEMIALRQWLDSIPVEYRRALIEGKVSPGDHGFEGKGGSIPNILRSAGMTWESVSGWIQGPMDAEVWEAIIPSMGYMALLRNLRNFDEAGVSDKVAQQVAAKIADPDEVAKSKQLPFRFWNAFKNVPSTRWLDPISRGLDASLRNIPTLTGRTLMLLDGSSSMGRTFTQRQGRIEVSSYGTRTHPGQDTKLWEQAALFALALAAKQNGNVDFYVFDGTPRRYQLTPGSSTLREMERIGREIHGGTTATSRSIRETYLQGKHDRVVVFTDEQADHDGLRVFGPVPDRVPCYTFNIAGYRVAHSVQGTPTRHGISGMTDSAFKLMGVIEARAKGTWPWQQV